MDELINRIITNSGVDADTAREAVRIILSFLFQQGDRDKVATLAKSIPGAEQYVEATEDDSASLLGGLGGMVGGGAMAVLGKLQGIGLGMGQIQSVTKETVKFAREKAGQDVVDDIIASIPGLSQFV